MNKPDGGPAFPVSKIEMQGMSLRDWFAGKAMAAYLTDTKHPDNATPDIVAKWAYSNADAMLKERERKEG